ncbi:uncharacterized protein LOC112573069 isoform X2 [Pomacea canaliculata]|uniref:uncharacterized protein LOC112573069 isoform X2 n=1 Tax=Pomacea canaliculata TaxID=400727 RepID=UPI000D739DB9|nr:uncharacterized protein LOC112573069 isoform X2 [Pomacea canaliculata]
MAADGGQLSWKCYECNMTFGNPTLLQKHKTRFCVGGQLGDPELLLLQRGLRSEDPPNPHPIPEDNDPPRYNPRQDPKIQQLAESHGRQMEFLHNRNRELERQREEIRRRLEELGRRPPREDHSTEELLRELKEQEARNQRLLDELKQQLLEARRSVNIVKTEPERQTKSYIYPIYYGNSLVAEIVAVRQAYLQNGGNDPDILAQLAQMQAEAQAIDDSMRNAQKKGKDRKDGVPSNLLTLELENERLQRQLLLLQEQKIISTNRRKDNREDELDQEIRRLHRDHLQKMYQLQREIERLRQETLFDRMRFEMQPPPPTKIILQQQGPQQPQRAYVDLEQTVPYDQYAGFVMFYDFVLNLDPSITAIRLLVGLHNLSSKLGEPTVLPLVYTEPATRQNYPQNVCNAVIGARQPVPRCPPQSDLGIVVELQAAGATGSQHDPTRLITRAWSKIPLFDGQGRLMPGRFKLPLRCSPIKPYIPFGELDSIPQYGDAELYYRVVHYRDASVQSLATIAAINHDLYQTAPTGGVLPQTIISPHLIPPPPSTLPPDSPHEFHSPRHASRMSNLPRIGMMNSAEPIIGFQVDRVKHSELGEGKVRLTAYYVSTGKVVQSSTSPVTCSTTAVKSNFKYGYHIFGQQEATFHDVQLQGDMLVIARFYLKRQPSEEPDDLFLEPRAQEKSLYEEESLVAWAVIPLVLCANPELSARARRDFDPSTMKINTGTHVLKLYEPPVPEPNRISLQDIYNREWRRYRNATLRIHIFQGQPRPGSLTPSDLSDDNEDVLPEFAWLPLDRRHPPTEPFMVGDGFDIYIDGCRFLPESVSFSRVTGRIMDRRYEVYGKDISTSVKLDSDIYNPVYEHKEEFREPTIPPSATLYFKVYTIDKYYRTLTVVGHATLNVFVETGTVKQPSIDKQGMQVSLNEGSHQLRLYNQGPNGVDPFTESSLRDAHSRHVPCASLLVRLFKAPKGPNGKLLESSKHPQSDWARLGLWYPRPKYSDRIYMSSKCTPTKGETKLFHAMIRRRPVTVREAVASNAKAKDSFLRSDKNMEQYIRNQLTKSVDAKPLDQDLTFIVHYSPRHGIKIALDSALNLPWSNFTHGHICLNPPGAFYMGTPHATYDKLIFTEKLNIRSTHSSPAWQDGYKHFPRRSFHRFLVAVIHLQEIFVNVTRDSYKYGLLEQAWTAVQVFKEKYANTATFQLPLFKGPPSQQMLKQLAREPCKEWMEKNIRNGTIKLIEGASVFVRLCDARRDDELAFDVPSSRLVEINTDYIPRGMDEIYSREKAGNILESLVPHGKNPGHFMDGLAIKFKSLVYKLYEEGVVSNT